MTPSGLRIASAATATSPASASHAGEEGHDQDARLFFAHASKIRATLEHLKPLLIDQIMVQMGWPTIGLRIELKDILAICCALLLAQWRIEGNWVLPRPRCRRFTNIPALPARIACS
jgi:hypothetical protein